jgi:adenosine deaminase
MIARSRTADRWDGRSLTAGIEHRRKAPQWDRMNHGVKITVNSDDFTVFGASVSDEILNLAKMRFAAEDITRIVENGLREVPE